MKKACKETRTPSETGGGSIKLSAARALLGCPAAQALGNAGPVICRRPDHPACPYRSALRPRPSAAARICSSSARGQGACRTENWPETPVLMHQVNRSPYKYTPSGTPGISCLKLRRPMVSIVLIYNCHARNAAENAAVFPACSDDALQRVFNLIQFQGRARPCRRMGTV